MAERLGERIAKLEAAVTGMQATLATINGRLRLMEKAMWTALGIASALGFDKIAELLL